jgi:CRP-like cAMP-binding protein
MAESRMDALRFLENVIFLKKFTLFSGLETAELRALALIAKEVSLIDGEYAVREGDAGDSFFIVKSGALRIVKNEGLIELARVGRGECFGEMALFEDGLLRSADVRADGASILLAFQREDFFDVLNRQPGISIELLRIFSRRLREKNLKQSEQKE